MPPETPAPSAHRLARLRQIAQLLPGMTQNRLAGLEPLIAAHLAAAPPDDTAPDDTEAAFRESLGWLIDRTLAEAAPSPARAARARLVLGQGRRAAFRDGPGRGVTLRIDGYTPAPGDLVHLTTTGGWIGAFTMTLPLGTSSGAALAEISQPCLAALCPAASARVTAEFALGARAARLLFRLDRFGDEVVPQPFVLAGGLADPAGAAASSRGGAA